tara:strand:+ start:365 stop:508 length:144 start_codon:yes stop_codon:yes gene_type:complete
LDKDFREIRDRKVHREIRVLRVLLVSKLHKETRVIKDFKDRKVSRVR